MSSLKIFIINLLFIILSCEDNYFIKIGEKTFPFNLKDTAAANELKAKLPFQVQMTKMNNNEIYYKFNEKFTTDTKSVETINTGDIYLYQSDYLVLFYKTFQTSYQYSELGKLTNTDGLAEEIDSSSSILVDWCMNNCLNEDENKSNLPTTDSSTTDSTTTDSSTTDSSTTDEVYDNVKDKANQSFYIRFNYMAYLLIMLIIIFK